MIFASVSTDVSAGVPDVPLDTDAALTKFDLTRVSAGASFRLGRADLMLGVGYAEGSNAFPSIFDTSDIRPDFDLAPDTRLRLRQWTFVIGAELLPSPEADGS